MFKKRTILLLTACLFFLSCSPDSETTLETVIETSLPEAETEAETESQVEDTRIANQFIETEYYSGEYNAIYDNFSVYIKQYVKLNATTCFRGETVEIETFAVNLGQAFIDYNIEKYGPYPTLQLSNIPENPFAYEIYYLNPDFFVLPDIVPFPELFKTGETWGIKVIFQIPANAIPGYYDVLLSTNRYKTIAKKALVILP